MNLKQRLTTSESMEFTVMDTKKQYKMTKIDNIKDLYAKIQSKLDAKGMIVFRRLVGEEFGVKEKTIRTNWFYDFQIPEDRYGYSIQDRLISFMQNYIAKLNQTS